MSETEQKPAEDKKEQVEIKQEDVQKSEEPQQEEKHEHEHDHEHEHEHEHPEQAKKSNRGEKKFKKAMLKLGMKQVTGINRVTIKKTKQLLLYIDNPEVLKSAGQDNSYIIFGEAKIHDMPQNIANEEVKKFQPEKPTETEQVEEQSEKKEEGDKTEEVKDVKEEKKDEKEVEVTQDNIDIVMEQAKCTKEKAIETLKKCNNDAVTAIMELSA